MEDNLKEEMAKLIKKSGADEGMLDDDMTMILDDLSMDMDRLKKMLVEKGMDEMKAMETMKKIAGILMEQEDNSIDEEW